MPFNVTPNPDDTAAATGKHQANKVYLGAVKVNVLPVDVSTELKLVNGSCNSELPSMKKLPPDFNGRTYTFAVPPEYFIDKVCPAFT